MGVLVTDHWTYSFDLLPWRMIQCELQARGALPHIPGARRWPVWGRHLCQTRCRWSIPKDFIELNFMKGLFPEGLFPSGTSLVAQTVKRLAYNAGDLGSIPGSGRSSGEGNGNPLQYSCPENPMDKGAWRATVHRVPKSRTRLSNFTFTISIKGGWGSQRLETVGSGKGTRWNFQSPVKTHATERGPPRSCCQKNRVIIKTSARKQQEQE